MWNNFTGFIKQTAPNRPNMNEARKQSKRAGAETSEPVMKRVAFEDITNSKKPIDSKIVKIDKTQTIVSNVQQLSEFQYRSTSSKDISSSKISNTVIMNQSSMTSNAFPFVTQSSAVEQPQTTSLVSSETLNQQNAKLTRADEKILSEEEANLSSAIAESGIISNNNNSSSTEDRVHYDFDLMDVEDSRPSSIQDIDAKDHDDPAACTCYINEIYHNLRKSELRYMPNTNYIDSQRDINSSMRCILIDWLVEVAEEYKLASETLYLSINYLDRFLSKQHIMRGNLQLLGIVCMLIASKFEEVYAPAVDEFVYISDNTYSKEEIFEMEGLVLNILNFNLCPPTPRCFIKRYLKAAGATEIASLLANYILEMTLLDYVFVKFAPSKLALCAAVLALYTNGHQPWNQTIEYYSGYSFQKDSELRECLKEMHTMYYNSPRSTLQAIRDKYSNPKFMRVATIPPPRDPPVLT